MNPKDRDAILWHVLLHPEDLQEPSISIEVGGSRITYSDGQWDWLTWWEILQYDLGWRDAVSIQKRRRPVLAAYLCQMSKRHVLGPATPPGFTTIASEADLSHL